MTGYAYDITTRAPNSSNEAFIGASWTRGLVVQPVGTLSHLYYQKA